MTLLSEGPVVAVGADDDVPVQHRPWSWRSAAEHVVVVAALAWWATALVNGTGGRDAGPLTVQVALLLAAALVTDGSRRSAVTAGVCAAVPLAAVLVCLGSPARWHGALDVAAYSAAALAYLVATSYASSTRRALLVLCAIVVAGFYEFVQAFVPWWGSGIAATKMVGTFYWHNPFAAYLLAPALLGLAFAVWRVKPVRISGWLFTPLIAAGVVYSTSRASIALLLLGWLAVGVLAVRSSRRHVARWLAVTALAAVVTVGLAQGPFFAQSSSPLAPTQQRAAEQDLTGNGVARLEFWRQSAQVTAAYPALGPGFREFGTAGRHVFKAASRSPYVHNGFLQPFADGGVVFGLTFLGAFAAAAVAVFRRRRTTPVAVALPWGALAVPLVVVLVHSGVDFDWTHPSNLVLVALLAGTLAALPRSPGTTARGRAVAAAAVGAVVLAGALGAAAGWGAGESRHAAVAAQRAATLERAWRIVQAADERPFTDERASAVLLQRAVATADGDRMTPGMWRHVLDRTAPRAEVDDRLSIARAAGYVRSGHASTGAAMVRARLDRLGPFAAPFVASAATVLDDAGQHAEARDLLVRYVRVDLATSSALTWVHVATLAQLAPTDEVSACAWQAASAVGPAPADVPPPTTTTTHSAADCAALLGTRGGQA